MLTRWVRITFQENTVTQDADTGEEVDSWSDVKTVSAVFRETAGKADTRDGQLEERTTTEFMIRYPRQGGWFPTTAMRISFRSRTRNVAAVMDKSGRGDWLTIRCEEIVS